MVKMTRIFFILLAAILITFVESFHCFALSDTTKTNYNITNIYQYLDSIEKRIKQKKVTILYTNDITTENFYQEQTTKIRLTYDPLPINEPPYIQSLEERYQIIFLVSIPATYMVSKFLMEQVSFYNYRDNERKLNTQQWAYIILNSILIPLIVATEDNIKYKQFLEKKLGVKLEIK